jgi:hypothetical protein
MKRSFPDILVGLAIFGFITIFIIWLAVIGWVIPAPITNWLNNSPDPWQAVVAFGTLVSATTLVLLRGGIALPIFQRFISESGIEKIRKYVAGLPLWAMLAFIALSLFGLLPVFLTCDPPTSLTFEIAGRNKLHSSELLIVKPGETLSISAKSDSGERLHCQWQYAGEAFPMLGTRQGCDIKIDFSPKPGEGFLTLLASKNFCNQSSVFSLPVKVEQP